MSNIRDQELCDVRGETTAEHSNKNSDKEDKHGEKIHNDDIIINLKLCSYNSALIYHNIIIRGDVNTLVVFVWDTYHQRRGGGSSARPYLFVKKTFCSEPEAFKTLCTYVDAQSTLLRSFYVLLPFINFGELFFPPISVSIREGLPGLPPANGEGSPPANGESDNGLKDFDDMLKICGSWGR